MGTPVDNKNFYDNYKFVYQDGRINPVAGPQKPFDVSATEEAYKTKKDLKKDNRKGKKKDKDGKEIADEEEEKPRPRPMGL
jgi:adenine specific DNA methylase Mod